jgi:hypothetical protein
MLARATSEIEAANLALGHIKVPATTGFDVVPRGTVCKQYFASVRDQLLAETWWNFATGDERLSRIVPSRSTDDTSYPHRFRLPEDCIAVRFVEGEDLESWQIEAPRAGEADGVNYLASKSEGPLRVTFTRRVSNVALWSPGFLEIFTLRLGAAINPQLGKDNSITAHLTGDAARLLEPHKKRNAREKAKSKVKPTSSWLASRWGGGYG